MQNHSILVKNMAFGQNHGIWRKSPSPWFLCFHDFQLPIIMGSFNGLTCSSSSTIVQEAQPSLGKTYYSLYTSYCSIDLEGHPRSMIFMSSERAYGTSYQWLIVILTVYLTAFEIWPVFHWKMQIFSTLSIQPQIWKCFFTLHPPNFVYREP